MEIVIFGLILTISIRSQFQYRRFISISYFSRKKKKSPKYHVMDYDNTDNVDDEESNYPPLEETMLPCDVLSNTDQLYHIDTLYVHNIRKWISF